MNIFAVDQCPEVSGRVLPDKLIVKMPLESAQMLCTAVVLNRPWTVYRKIWKITYKWAHFNVFLAFWCRCEPIYTPTHANHPCNVWARENQSNFTWLYLHAVSISEEYTNRYGKTHKSLAIIHFCSEHVDHLPDGDQTEFSHSFPDEFESDDVHSSYREYLTQKSYFPGFKKGRDFSNFYEV